jgi:hypothetical protein
MKKVVLIVIVVVFFSLGLYLDNILWNKKDVKEKVTRETIVTGLKNEGFLVSQTYILNQTVTIDRSTGSKWKDIFWGQDIEASGVVKIGAGVDLSKLTTDDVELSQDKITITLPKTKINSTELLNGINIKNKQGILKRLLDNDDGYNTAFEKLRQQAVKSVEGQEFVKATQDSAVKMVKKFIRFVDKDKEIIVKFKK